MSKNKYLIFVLLCVSFNLLAADFNWYSQNDQRWKSDKLGQSYSTIGSSGCVLSCLSMLLNAEASNPHITPDQLNAWLKQNGGYRANDMRWQIPGMIDGSGFGLELVRKSTKRNDWKFLSEELALGHKVIVKVANRRSHWVLVIKQDGPADSASSYIVNDPGMDRFEQRTLANFGGFRAANSYAGNWLDEEAFRMDSKLSVVPVQKDEFFLFDMYKLPHPADVFVQIQNNLTVNIHGFFILGLFDNDGNYLKTLDYEYAKVPASGTLDLIYQIDEANDVLAGKASVKIIYSKYFSNIPSANESIQITEKKDKSLPRFYNSDALK